MGLFSWIASKLRSNDVVVDPLPKVNVPTVTGSSTVSPNWAELWGKCQIDQNRVIEIQFTCEKIKANKAHYDAVASQLNIPWYLIAALHYREASLDFNTCLHNGDPLPGPTRHVPRGRGPFLSWEAAAIDALKLDGLDKVSYPDIPSCLAQAEKFNGLGYRKHGIYSPYNTAGTNLYTCGKYTSDGSYSASAKDAQLGVMAIFKVLGL